METTIAKVDNTGLTFLSADQLKKYEEADKAVYELLDAQVHGRLKGIQLTFAKMTVVGMIEKVLDKPFMDEVMKLQNKPYGFKTDCDLKKTPPEKYPEDVVKNCVIQAILHGAEITGNEFNILGGNAYFTKEYCENYLIKNKIKFKTTIGFSKRIDQMWVVPVKLDWTDPRDNKAYSENLDIPVNKFEKTKEDTLRGQARRDALAWLISTLRETPIPMGNAESNIIIDTEATEIKNEPTQAAQPTQSETVVQSESVSQTVEQQSAPVQSQPAQPTQSSLPKATSEQQADFDKFISNREKYKDFDGLKKRAQTWCETKGIKSEQLDMSTFTKIRDELIMPKN